MVIKDVKEMRPDEIEKEISERKQRNSNLIYSSNMWTVNLLDTWKLVDEAREDGFAVQINYFPGSSKYFFVAECKLFNRDGLCFKGSSDTPEVAICRAWLEWKRQQEVE